MRPSLVLLLPVLLTALGCSSPPAAPAPAAAPGPPSSNAATPRALATSDAAPPRAAPARDAPATAVVAWWDDRRAQAWRGGDVGALQELYLPGSRAGAADVAALRAYVSAGVALTGWQTARRAVTEVRRTSDRLVVDVRVQQRDTRARLAAVRDGEQRTLPASAPRDLRLSLDWAWPLGGWAVQEVREVRPIAGAGSLSVRR
ncbi:hypothetical protein KLP28_02720 [Nocardioidaceae bacterium]|nr:hypothetical protein KLP28_02720 [Nocardioidaceae bacterium]